MPPPYTRNFDPRSTPTATLWRGKRVSNQIGIHNLTTTHAARSNTHQKQTGARRTSQPENPVKQKATA
jgi:hypothetical protein